MAFYAGFRVPGTVFDVLDLYLHVLRILQNYCLLTSDHWLVLLLTMINTWGSKLFVGECCDWPLTLIFFKHAFHRL